MSHQEPERIAFRFFFFRDGIMRLLLIVIVLGSANAMAQPLTPAPAAPSGQVKTRMGVSVTVITDEKVQQPKTPQNPGVSR